MKKFVFYSDPAHGWLKVPRKLLVELEISDKISSCSYQNDDDVFLEEDCDCFVFDKAYFDKYGQKPSVQCQTPSNRHSRIRNYQSYKP